MDDLQIIRAKLESIHFDKPNDTLPKEIEERANKLLPQKEPEELNKKIQDQTYSYLENINADNVLINKLMTDIADLKNDLDLARQQNKALQSRLDDFSETSVANINKCVFNYYVEATLERKATLEDWKKFTRKFEYDNFDLDKKIYAWIGINLRK
jgi:hypothetical protein